ncbi:unnamed protein product [[Candida] boidinii]|nr:unnamed protein product [[Candida] boidinii]
MELWNYEITTAQRGYPETSTRLPQGCHKARQDMTGHNKPRMAPDLCTPHTGLSLSAVSLVVPEPEPEPAPCYHATQAVRFAVRSPAGLSPYSYSVERARIG